ncbi:MAG: bifunctional methylenetetrahydrofolate dehydrogenase/methenyltetrahydrofolate cyclohydrolase FolD [Clostridia bacterium]|nr:bifunctional methylenetetrahydrofolate dehydrogenase/methenyltetrahydrofolate cyclohydrolase FolD [Clostridia bacterium]
MHQVSFPALGLEFAINEVAFTVGNYDIRWYAVIIATGFILAFLYAMHRASYFHVDTDKMFDCIIVGFICAIVGARLYYVIFSWDDYKDNLISILYIHQGGLAIYGGLIGALLGGCITAKVKKINIPGLLDLAALGFLIGQGLGRWGNFMNQEAFGTETSLPWGMLSDTTGGVTVHPCFLYESLWCLIGFVLLHFFSKKFQRYFGQLFILYIIWYGAERMIVEGLRTDSLYMPFSIGSYTPRVSQVLSFALVVAGVILLIVFRKRRDTMGAVLLDGKAVSAKVKEDVAKEIAALKEKGTEAKLAVVIVGDDPASRVYVNNKKKACEACGIVSEEYALPADTTNEQLLSLVKELNDRKDLNGILVQLPLPKGLDEKKVIETIRADKDVDAFHASNVGKIMIGEYDFLPCTPAGVMEILYHYDCEIEGKNCVVIGRSNIVGKPMAMLLLHDNGTVTVCHSKTKNLKKVTKEADILVAAVGRPKFVTADMVKPGAVVVDVGIHRMDDGKLCGDVDFDKVKDKASFITPVPGGVGPMTIAMLMKNTLKACKLQNNID